MPGTHTGRTGTGRLADEAEHTIRRLTHLTRPATSEPADPGDTADIIAALATMTWTLPQLLAQLAQQLHHEHRAGRLRTDDPDALPDPGQTVQALTSDLQHADRALRAAAEALDAAHQHAAHLAAANPDHNPTPRGQHSCRTVGPNHLTRLTGEAKPLYERALRIQEAHYGPDHPDVAAALSNLGAALRELGKTDRAVDCYTRAWRIFCTRLGPDHAYTRRVGRALRSLDRIPMPDCTVLNPPPDDDTTGT